MSWSKFGVLGLVATGALLTGCTEETVGSDVIRTGGMWADFTVTATRANEANAKAALHVGGRNADTLALLVAPDTLLVGAGDEEKVMTPSGCENNRYCAKFNQNLGGKEVTFKFDRGEENENAPNSSVEMPEPFSLSVASSVERGRPVVFTWDGSGGALEWEIKGNCIWTEDGFADDDGSYAINASRIRQRSGREDDECEVTLTVTRTETGFVDSSFAGGSIRAIQKRTKTFISYPEGGDEPEPTTGDTTTTDTTTTDTSTGPDAGPSDDDGGTTEAGSPEAGSPEAGSPEAGSPEAGSPEAGSPEAGSPEAGSPEAGSPEAGSPEAGSPEAGSPDSGPGPDAGDAG